MRNLKTDLARSSSVLSNKSNQILSQISESLQKRIIRKMGKINENDKEWAESLLGQYGRNIMEPDIQSTRSKKSILTKLQDIKKDFPTSAQVKKEMIPS